MADQQPNHMHTIEREALERILRDASAEPIQISYQFVKSITKNFSEVIGRGGFGEVYLGFHRNEKKVAVKKIFGSQNFSDKPFLDELNCLMMVKHKNIARFVAYCAETKEQLIKHEGRFILADARQRFLCFEYVPNGNLHAYLKDSCRGDDWQTRYQMIIGVCQGLNYLHQKRINHLDLKPENILLDALMEPKITDFGLSRFFSEGQSRIITRSIVGTLGYVAPEILQNGEISFKADVYSLGSIIIKLLTGHDKYDYENWHKSVDVENPQLKSCMEIARNCRNDDQHKRPLISEIICQLKDIESFAENGSWVNHELRHGRQLSAIYQVCPICLGNPSDMAFDCGRQVIASIFSRLTARRPTAIAIATSSDFVTNVSSKGLPLQVPTSCSRDTKPVAVAAVNSEHEEAYGHAQHGPTGGHMDMLNMARPVREGGRSPGRASAGASPSTSPGCSAGASPSTSLGRTPGASQAGSSASSTWTRASRFTNDEGGYTPPGSFM